MRHPTGGRPVTKEQAAKNVAETKEIGRRIKKGVTGYAKNVVGGAKIVGGAVKKRIKKALKPGDLYNKFNRAKTRTKSKNIVLGKKMPVAKK